MSKTGKGLAEYAIAQLGKPYWWGTFGQTADAGLLSAKRQQYPDYYTASDFTSQFGQKVHDCVGLIKGYLWCDTPDSAPKYKAAQDVAVNGLYLTCKEHGSLGTIPEEPGVCVFMANMGHVGVYIGNGCVVEAMGHAYGVVKTQLKGRGWSYWGKPGWIEYTGASTIDAKPTTTVAVTSITGLPVLRSGAKTEYVRSAQLLLIGRGYSCGSDGADGEYGRNTRSATEKFQQDHSLEVDGIIGNQTWTRLLGG